jgi:hypothetical protein
LAFSPIFRPYHTFLKKCPLWGGRLTVLAEQNDEWEVTRCYMTFGHETTKLFDSGVAEKQSQRRVGSR